MTHPSTSPSTDWQRQIVQECARQVYLHATSMREESVTIGYQGVSTIADGLLSRFDHDGFGLKSSDGGRTSADRTDQMIRSEAGAGRETDPSQGIQHGAGVAPGPSEAIADLIKRLADWNHGCKTMIVSETIDTLIRLSSGAAQKPTVPDGFALVPIEPTKEMIQASIWALDRWREKHGNVQGHVPPGEKYQIRWRAMLAASPSTANTAWLPIETAPKNNTRVLLWYPWTGKQWEHAPLGFHYLAIWACTQCDHEDAWRDPDNYEKIGEGATHWMPLPGEPPKNSADTTQSLISTELSPAAKAAGGESDPIFAATDRVRP